MHSTAAADLYNNNIQYRRQYVVQGPTLSPIDFSPARITATHGIREHTLIT